ncbi:hypothetical protein HHI36_000125 [Cryptolaemus montrouzieri]|uniref:Uncharacterized protein n=1 Tax=Cryptolaemus montrouzieri TaxID=559131 RepID=A0ABD2P3Q5_9CUCU
MWSTILFFLAVIRLCFSYDNTSSIFDGIHVVNKARFESRQNRLISFQTLDEGISVELDFSVPFIKIPVKKSLSFAEGTLANINVGALVLSGGLVVGITLLMPILIGVFSKQMTYPPSWKKSEQFRSEYLL